MWTVMFCFDEMESLYQNLQYSPKSAKIISLKDVVY